MTLPVKPFRISIVFALAIAGVTATNAQSLNQPNPLGRFSDMVQFSVSRDIRFAFCDEEDCPERSIKHLYIPPPPLSAVQEPVVPASQSIQPLEELSHTKAPVKEKPLKKKRKRPTIQYGCKPVNKLK